MIEEAINRLEGKVDELTAAVLRLVVVEERQAVQATHIVGLEQAVTALAGKQEAVDRKVDKWINRGMGVWGFVVVLFAVGNSEWFTSRWRPRNDPPAPHLAVMVVREGTYAHLPPAKTPAYNALII